MQKLTVKATKLKRNDVINVAGTKYRVTSLNHHFGGTFERVSLFLAADIPSPHRHFTKLEVCPKSSFNIKRPNKK